METCRPLLINPFAEDGSKVYVYDLETYGNCFLGIFYDGGKYSYFTMQKRNLLVAFLDDPKKVLIGYNNNGFDDTILKAIISGEVTTDQDAYVLAQEIISGENKDRVKALQYRGKITWGKSIDLMQMCFRDDDSGRGKASLKDLAVRLKHRKIQELPYRFDSVLADDQKRNVLKYCENDVVITAMAWNELHGHAVLRSKLQTLFDVNVGSLSEAQVSEALFENLYTKRMKTPAKQICEYIEKRTEIAIAGCIPNWVRFTTEYMQKFLASLNARIVRCSDGQWDRHILKETVEIGGKTYNFAAGGLHSKDDAGVFEKTPQTKIIDVDVTSYYPSILLRDELHPAHLTSTWTNILREITLQRIDAKKKGDKLAADALKIVINAAFGKCGNQYSFMYDPALMLTVTITGELALLMLIECLATKGFTVISANTDGVTTIVPIEREKDFQSILAWWEGETKFHLEEAEYEKYVRQDVNNYLALPVGGKPKTKGIFAGHSLFKKVDAMVVTKAMTDYFLAGEDVEKTIRDHKDAFDFCYSYKTTANFMTIYNGGHEMQRINRWYVSTSGERLAKKRIKGTATTKEGQEIKLCDRAAIANDMPENFPSDIDYRHYITEAKETINKIMAGVVAMELAKVGLHPIPKDAKRNPAGAKLAEVKTDWDYGAWAGVGIYTGDFVGALVLDFDHPEKVPAAVFVYLSGVKTMEIWHGEHGDIAGGKKRGSLVFECHNGLLQSTDAKFLSQYGFEILYGKKTAQVFGLHTSGEEYHYAGDMAKLPEQLELWLLEHSKRKKTKAKADNTGDLFEEEEPGDAGQGEPAAAKVTTHDGDTISDEEKAILREIVGKLLPGWRYSEEDTEEKFKLFGFCPFSDEHTLPPKPTEFDVVLLADRADPRAGCWHKSCRESVQKLEGKVRELYADRVSVAKRDQKLAAIEIPCESPTEIGRALQSVERDLGIFAPTGSGKTHESALFFLELLKRKIPVSYVASTRTDQDQFRDMVEAFAGATVEDLYVHVLHGENKIDEESDGDSTKIGKNVMGIITHHTYLKRKKMSNLFFSYLGWVKDNRPVMLIDEADSFLTGLSMQIQIGARYRRRQRRGAKYAIYEKLDVCPAHHHSGNCRNCYYKENQQYLVDAHGMPDIVTTPRMDQKEFDTPKKLEVPEIVINKKITVKNAILSQIEKHPNHLEHKIYRFRLQDGETFDSAEAIRDMVDCAHLPIIYREMPMLDGEPIYPEKISDDLWHTVKFPYQPCNVPILSMKDCSVISWLKRHARATRWLTATMGPSNREFLQAQIPEFKSESISESAQQIDELLIIGCSHRITHVSQEKKKKEIFFEGLDEFGKVLIFEPRKEGARQIMKDIPRNIPAGIYIDDTVNVNEKYAQGQWKALVTYSRGPLGRAVNLPEFFTVIIDSRIYRPAYSFDLQTMSNDEIELKRFEDRMTHIVQNAGRILRGNTGRKCMIVHCADQGDIEYMALQYEKLVRNPVKTLYFDNEYTVSVKDAAIHWHKTGEVLTTKDLLQVARECSMEKITRKEREKVREKLGEIRKEDRLERLKKEAESFAGTWVEFSNKCHVYRAKKKNQITDEDIALLKSMLKRG